jgi:hypothetical protein
MRSPSCSAPSSRRCTSSRCVCIVCLCCVCVVVCACVHVCMCACVCASVCVVRVCVYMHCDGTDAGTAHTWTMLHADIQCVFGHYGVRLHHEVLGGLAGEAVLSGDSTCECASEGASSDVDPHAPVGRSV